MAAYAQPAPRARAIPEGFFAFLRAELAPRPGMYSKLARVLITIVITFLIAATFRMPYAAITLYSVFTIDRSSRRAALLRAIESITAVSIGVLIALAGVDIFIEFPMLTFVYYALELFLAAFLIRTTRLQGPAMNMEMAIYSVYNTWEPSYPAGAHIEQTLWVWLTLCLGFAISVLVEFAFVREDSLAEIHAQLAGRLRALSSFFAALAGRSTDTAAAGRSILSYANTSTAPIRERIASLRNTDAPLRQQQLLALNTITAVVGRLIDVSATIDPELVLSEEDRQRLLSLAAELERIRVEVQARGSVSAGEYQPSSGISEKIPALPELERATMFIPTAFSASRTEPRDPALQIVDVHKPFSVFLPDAFTNPGYLLFAFKTMFAAMLCYVIYSGLDWQGISTSVVTCLVTALNTVGATRQKQLLRISLNSEIN